MTDVGAVSWPLQHTFAIGDGSQPVLERAMHAGELQVVERVGARRDVVPLGANAVDRGSTATAVAPLEAGDELYGVLVVYGDEAVTDDERTAIESIADTASYAIESIAVCGKLDQQERALHRYERLVETAGDGMYDLDEEGHFTTVNEALLEMTGYRHEGLLGERVSALFSAADSEASDAPVETLLESEATTDTVEAGLETKAGETIPCEIRIAALSRGDAYRGSVGVVRDVTDRKRRERRLEEQNERLDAFTRIVSHDLRNPLGVAQGYVDLLAETEWLEHLENVRNGLDRMETIVDDVLAITREGRTAVDADRVDLAAAAEDAWNNVSTANATLTVEDTLEFDADRTRLLRLFENLYRNAVEHGSANEDCDEPAENPRDGLTVHVGPLEGMSTGFYVADDSRGLPEQIRETAFDSTESSLEAFGLGLWIVEEVAVGHGWSAAATESVDGGARFEFEIEGGQFSD